jgi:hypothetical protein
MDPLQPWLDAKEVRRLAEGLLAPPPEVEEAAVDAAYGEVFEGFAGGDDTPTLAKPSEATVVDSPDKQEVQPAPQPLHKTEAKAEDKAEDKAVDEGSIDDALPQQADTPNIEVTSPSEVAEESAQTVEPIAAQVDSPFHISANQNHSAADVMAAKFDSQEDKTTNATASEISVSASDNIDVASPSPVDSDEPIRKLDARGPFLSRIRQFSQVVREDLGAKAMFLIDVNGQILLDEVENAKLIQVARTLANASQRANRQSAGAAAVGNLHVKIGANSTLEVIPVDSRYGLLILGVIFPGPIGAVRVMQVADELHRTIESRR